MAEVRLHRSTFQMLTKLTVCCLAVGCFAYAQIPYLDQEVQVHGLPSLMARTHDPADVLLTSLDTVIHDREVCCGKDSALEDSALAADPKSLKEIASRLEGRHLLSDGRPIVVTTEFLAPDQVNSGHLITMILNQHAPLMKWNSHIYVVHGVVYIWTADQRGSMLTEIYKLLLLDTRYSDSRREVVFTRGVDDADKIQGMLFLRFKPQ